MSTGRNSTAYLYGWNTFSALTYILRCVLLFFIVSDNRKMLILQFHVVGFQKHDTDGSPNHK